MNDKNKNIYRDNSVNANSPTISGYNTNESSQNNVQEEAELKKKVIKNSKKSRFSFVNNTDDVEQNQFFVVPDFINEILNKKFNSMRFASYIQKNRNELIEKNFFENILLAEEIKLINSWANSN